MSKGAGRQGKRGTGQRRMEAQGPKKSAATWIWGINPILELLRIKPDQLLEINILAAKAQDKIDEIEELAGRHAIPCRRVSRLVNEEVSTHQGVEATIKPISYLSLPELLQQVEGIPQPFFLALDSIQDPHNLGAIIRSASAAGVNGIIIPRDRAAAVTGTVTKTAAGAITMVSLCQVTNLADSLKRLKDDNFWIYGADGSASSDIYGADFRGPLCLVIGGEGKGIRPLVKKQCDLLLSIPMHSPLDSLNASVATGVILFEMTRQRTRN